MAQNDNQPNLTRQRIFIAVMVILALFLAISTIYNTLINQGDAVPPDSPPTTQAPAAN
ncbi:MAG TPA: hypothetical protein VGM83_15090 [Devosiaceae bacterium]|jgi:hypothetical protein